ncbi:UNVERIFIED_CONTAM: hypothetical protein HDU68_012408 [Siphonaria sp. JEL0065]|nr:hypothetical protein HDU68_012408 [Siphonaria sp. JEL0065]
MGEVANHEAVSIALRQALLIVAPSHTPSRIVKLLDHKERESALEHLGGIASRLVRLSMQHQEIMATSRRTALAGREHCITIASDLTLLGSIDLPRDQVVERLQTHRASAVRIRQNVSGERDACAALREDIIALVRDSLSARATLERIRGNAQEAADIDASRASWAKYIAGASLAVVIGGAAIILSGGTVLVAIGGGVAAAGSAGTSYVYNEFAADRDATAREFQYGSNQVGNSVQDQQIALAQMGRAHLFWEQHVNSIDNRLSELQKMSDSGAVNMFNGRSEAGFWNETANKMQAYIQRLENLALDVQAEE